MKPNERFAIGTVKSVAPEDADHDIEFVCSTDVVDRSDEVIEQDGWELDNFKANPVFLAAHAHRLADGRSPVIGSFSEFGVESGALVGRVRFAETDLGREYRTLYRDGHMRAVSVGFMPKEGDNRTGGDGAKRYHHTRQELYEVSAVAVGANQEALARLGLRERDDAGDQVDDDQADDTPDGDAPLTLAQFEAGLKGHRAAMDERFDEILTLITDDDVNEPDETPAAGGDSQADGDGQTNNTGESESVLRARRSLLRATERQ